MFKVVAAVVVAGVSALGARAQAPASESQLDPLSWGVVYDVPRRRTSGSRPTSPT
jgi:hypothetical protein